MTIPSGSAPLAAVPSEATGDDISPCDDPVEAAYLAECQSPPAAESSAFSELPDPEQLDDGQEETAEPAVTAPPVSPQPKRPWAGLTDRELEQKYQDSPESVGPMSVGSTNAGALVNGVQMPRGPRWELIDPAHAWGTQETVDALSRAIDKVHEQYPDAGPMQIGHLSARRGGPLSPHISHQSGRDVDVSYFYTVPERWFAMANADNLDRAKSWAFVRALLTETDVELILIDHSLQKLLREYAVSAGEDSGWIDEVFDGTSSRRALILHAKGHGTHIHVRFFNPTAQETARRLQPVLMKRGSLPPPMTYVLYRARSGDTLGSLARRYGTTVEAIQAVNSLRNNAIKARRIYRIPVPSSQKQLPASRPATPSPRRVPPAKHPTAGTGRPARPGSHSGRH